MTTAIIAPSITLASTEPCCGGTPATLVALTIASRWYFRLVPSVYDAGRGKLCSSR